MSRPATRRRCPSWITSRFRIAAASIQQRARKIGIVIFAACQRPLSDASRRSTTGVDSRVSSAHSATSDTLMRRKYPFEGRADSRNPAEFWPQNYSRLSCGIEETQLGPRAAGSRQASDRALMIKRREPSIFR